VVAAMQFAPVPPLPLARRRAAARARSAA